MKISDDKYYTPIPTANRCWDRVIEVIGLDSISEIIEPSCGDGAFYHHGILTPHFGYDIKPECDYDNVITQDFLSTNIRYLEGRLIIGNPPFGSRNNLSIKFYRKATEIADYIAFIQPISQYQNNRQMYQFDLVYSEDLGIIDYSKISLHCCFNIYRRPEKGLNEKPNYKLHDITIKEYRRNGSYALPVGYDYAMCNWGNGSLGKVPSYAGEYAQEVYFYCHKKEYLSKMYELLSFDTIRSYVNSISAKKISVSKLYEYLKNNIPGIE